MKKLYIFIRVLIALLLVVSVILFYRVKTIEKENYELENKINRYLELKESIDLYSNLLDNANIIEKDANQLEEEKAKIDKEVSSLELEISNLKEKIRKLS